MNSVNISGNLTHDPELKQFENTCVVNVNVAINNLRKTEDGELVNNPAFVAMEAWDSSAEYIAKRFKKGDLIIATCVMLPYQVDGKQRIKFRMTSFEGPYVKRKE